MNRLLPTLTVAAALSASLLSSPATQALPPLDMWSAGAMAADSLGRLRASDARTVIAMAKLDPDPVVARKARLAETRLR